MFVIGPAFLAHWDSPAIVALQASQVCLLDQFLVSLLGLGQPLLLWSELVFTWLAVWAVGLP